jgi:hypothetical protein
MHTLDFKEENAHTRLQGRKGKKNKFTFCSGIPGDKVLASIKVWGVRVLGFLRTAMDNGLRRSRREAARLKVAAVKMVK